MPYNLTIEQRREYRLNEIDKHGLYELNRQTALRRARKKGYVTPQSFAKYQFTSLELPFLDTPDGLQTGYSGRHRDQKDRAF
jgi:hypothetical protein